MATPLPNISSTAWEHPTDRAALNALKKIPGFDTVLRKIVGMFGEQGINMLFQANAVKVGPDQYPDLHESLLRCCQVLDVEPPKLFISQTPHANAGAVGVDKPFIVLNSTLIEVAKPEEVEAVIGHEVGHIASEHALYRTLLILLLRLGATRTRVIGAAMMPIVYALLEWSRKAELSCDRAGLLAVQDLDASLGVLAVLAGGIRGRRDELNIDAFVAQSDEYMDEEGIKSYYRAMGMLRSTHPYAVVRVAELRKWVQSGDYHRILDGEYVARGEEPPLREDTAEGLRHYSDAARRTFENAGSVVSKTLSDFADRLDNLIDRNDDDEGGDGGDGDGADGSPKGGAIGSAGDPPHNPDWIDPWDEFF